MLYRPYRTYRELPQYPDDPRADTLPPLAAHRYVNSEVVRQWLVMLALSSGKLNTNNELQEGLVFAFQKACEGVESGDIELDYQPTDPETLDMPKMGHPYYMQALLYWSVRLHCNPEVFAEMHATLGMAPSFENACHATRQIEREAEITESWKNSARRRRSGGDTMPAFHATNFSKLH